jgi:hypothetical protein
MAIPNAVAGPRFINPNRFNKIKGTILHKIIIIVIAAIICINFFSDEITDRIGYWHLYNIF